MMLSVLAMILMGAFAVAIGFMLYFTISTQNQSDSYDGPVGLILKGLLPDDEDDD